MKSQTIHIPVVSLVTSLLVGTAVMPRGAAQPQQAPSPAAPVAARVRCEVTENGAAAHGELVARDGSRAECGHGLSLPPGQQPVTVRLRGCTGHCEQTLWTPLKPGGSHVLQVSFETGELLLSTQGPDGPLRGRGKLWQTGAGPAELSSGIPVRVVSGTYVVDAKVGAHERRFEAVHVVPETRTVLAWHLQGTAPAAVSPRN